MQVAILAKESELWGLGCQPRGKKGKHGHFLENTAVYTAIRVPEKHGRVRVTQPRQQLDVQSQPHPQWLDMQSAC